MPDFFNDKVVVVTGGTDGIGAALVHLLLSKGARVATCGRNHDKLYRLQSEYPSYPLHTVVADVSNENDCRHFIESTIKVFNGIDVLINNAGVSMRALLKDTSIEVIRQVMDINFFGAVYCTKFALTSITERQGSIVGISSIAGYRGLPERIFCFQVCIAGMVRSDPDRVDVSSCKRDVGMPRLHNFQHP
jgi:NAD(P)-dependent dehydrogenase (short-subunit alcohol dehydrogenase family)